MNAFLKKHADKVACVLHCFDRLIVRGHLPIAGTGYLLGWMTWRKISLNTDRPDPGWKKFKDMAPWFSQRIKAHVQALAEKAGRPYRHLPKPERMDEQAAELARRDGIQEGLVCVFGAMERCQTFRIRHGETGPRLGPDIRVCLMIYCYYIDREYGLMHVKIQTWLPFTVQVYVNGHEWLARKLRAANIGFRQVDNAFVELSNPRAAQRCADRFARRDWPKLLARLAARVNPLLGSWLNGQSYYWVADQVEYSTDVIFKERRFLEELRPRLYEHAALCFSAPRVMTFLGRRYRENFAGEIKTHWHCREPGGAVKHWVKRNAIKMYDKHGVVLRIETVIQNPREFFVYRPRQRRDGSEQWGWFSMNKGVSNLFHYANVGCRANTAYLEALAVVDDARVGRRELERRLAPARHQGCVRRGLQPLSRADAALFTAAMRGEHAVRGFRNRELAEHLFGPPPKDPLERRRRCGRVSRLIGLLRAHGLVSKVPRARRYRVTVQGQRFMATAIQLREKHFPAQLSAVA